MKVRVDRGGAAAAAAATGGDGAGDAFNKQLSRLLTHVEASKREATVDRLRVWLKAREAATRTIEHVEFLKLWKALYFCMWLTDKPVVQDEMANSLATLARELSRPENVHAFFAAYLELMRLEWIKIDYLRMNKYLMQLRRMVLEWLLALDRAAWSGAEVDAFVRHLTDALLARQADGLRMHLAAVFVQEMREAGAASRAPPAAVRRALEPFLAVATAPDTSSTMFNAVLADVFKALAAAARDDAARVLDGPELAAVGDALFSAAADTPTLTGARRTALYDVAGVLRRAGGAAAPIGAAAALAPAATAKSAEKPAARPVAPPRKKPSPVELIVGGRRPATASGETGNGSTLFEYALKSVGALEVGKGASAAAGKGAGGRRDGENGHKAAPPRPAVAAKASPERAKRRRDEDATNADGGGTTPNDAHGGDGVDLNASSISESSQKSVRFSHADVMGLRRITLQMKHTPTRPSSESSRPLKGVLKPTNAPIAIAKPPKARKKARR